MLSKVNAERAYHLVAIPAALGLFNIGITKMGHVAGVLTKTTGWQAGVFGVVQGVAAKAFLLLGVTLLEKMNLTLPQGSDVPIIIGMHVLANCLAGAALLAISALAVKAGIMASSLALSGVVVLTLANTVLSFGGLIIQNDVLKALKDKQWIEA